MKPSIDIKPITYMKTKPAELIDRVTSQRRPFIITQNGRARVVVQDIASFERDREALFMLKILAQGVEDTKKGRLLDHEAVFSRLEKKIRRISNS